MGPKVHGLVYGETAAHTPLAQGLKTTPLARFLRAWSVGNTASSGKPPQTDYELGAECWQRLALVFQGDANGNLNAYSGR